MNIPAHCVGKKQMEYFEKLVRYICYQVINGSYS